MWLLLHAASWLSMQSHPDHADVAEPPAHDESYNSPQPLSDPGGNVTDNGTEDDLLSGAKSLGTAAESSAPLKANGLLEHTIDPGSNDITLGTDKGGDLLGDEALSAKKVRPKLPDASKLEGRETSEIADCDSATVSTTTLVRLTKGELPQSPKAPPPPPKDERFRTKPSMTGPSLMSLAREGNDPNFTEDSNLSLLAREMDAADGYEKDERANRGNADDSRSEIHSIMEQFDNGSGVLSAEEILSQRLEIGSPLAHPPRSSSLDHRGTETLIVPPNSSAAPTGSWIPPSETMANLTLKKKSLEPQVESTVLLNEKSSSVQGSQIAKTSTAQPDPEVALPFDFYRFLDQLRHRTADPVAKYVRSFLLEFAKKQWMVHEQVKIIGDFLEFISKRMAQCEVWSAVSEAEFDNAREGMEKLVMNRLYNQTFSPCIPSAEQAVDRSGRRKAPSPLRLGRRGQHQEDVERDKILAQKMRIYRWVSEKHLDIKEIREKGQKLLLLAQKGKVTPLRAAYWADDSCRTVENR